MSSIIPWTIPGFVSWEIGVCFKFYISSGSFPACDVIRKNASPFSWDPFCAETWTKLKGRVYQTPSNQLPQSSHASVLSTKWSKGSAESEEKRRKKYLQGVQWTNGHRSSVTIAIVGWDDRNNGAHICNNSMKSSNSARMSVPLPQPICEVLECLSHEEGWHVVSLGAGLIHIVQAGETIFPAAIGLIAASLLLDIHDCVPKKNPPLTRSKRKTGKNREIPQEFVAKQRLHSIKGDHQPLTPVPIDLQLGSPPHEIQAFNLGAIARLSSCWMAILRRYTILFRKLKFGDPWVLPKICLWPQDVVHGLQVILSSN